MNTAKLTLFCAILALIGCKEQYADYEDPSKPYNRKATCERLTEILREYDSPKDYKTKNISRRELTKYYNNYKIYGCEK